VAEGRGGREQACTAFWNSAEVVDEASHGAASGESNPGQPHYECHRSRHGWHYL